MIPRWKTEIESRMDDLQRGHEDLIHGRVTLTENRHHKKIANVAEALVVITLPGRHTLTARKEDKTFEEAIRTAFHAVKQLKDGTEVVFGEGEEKQRGYIIMEP